VAVRQERDRLVARAARLPLALAVLALAACGGGGGEKSGTTEPAASECPTQGRQVEFPLLDPAKTYTVDVRTNLGSFAFRLDVADSPCTTASFASLVRKRFFDGTRFHRIVPGFVIQGGDPTGSGSGGPGYTVVDEVPPKPYTRGVVAMAKAAAEPAGTSGSQFFVVTGEFADLPPDYARLGAISSGMDVVLHIGRLGNPTNEEPTRKIVIQRMTVTP
jgi:peptidyl-prolyl cis-trans isomerase B (cyclophilin B)